MSWEGSGMKGCLGTPCLPAFAASDTLSKLLPCSVQGDQGKQSYVKEVFITLLVIAVLLF